MTRGESDGLAQKLHGARGTVWFPRRGQQAVQLRPLILIQSCKIFFPKRGHFRFVAGRGANDGRDTRGVHLVKHRAEVRGKIACCGGPQRRVRGNESAADHSLH